MPELNTTAAPFLDNTTWRWESHKRPLVEDFLTELSKQYEPDTVLFERDALRLKITEEVIFTHRERERLNLRQNTIHRGITCLYPGIWLTGSFIGMILSMIAPAYGAAYSDQPRLASSTTMIMDTSAYTAFSGGSRLPSRPGITWYLFPVNIGNYHWVTGYVDTVAKRIHVEDPMGTAQLDILMKLRDWAVLNTSVPGDEWNLTTGSTTRQHNKNDCGIFLIADILCLLEDNDPALGQHSTSCFRLWLAWNLWSSSPLTIAYQCRGVNVTLIPAEHQMSGFTVDVESDLNLWALSAMGQIQMGGYWVGKKTSCGAELGSAAARCEG